MSLMYTKLAYHLIS